jgi:hypothetical protein
LGSGVCVDKGEDQGEDREARGDGAPWVSQYQRNRRIAR